MARSFVVTLAALLMALPTSAGAAGTNGSPTSDGPVSGRRVARGLADGALVWGRDGKDRAQTYRLHVRADGSASAEHIEGIVVATAGHAYRWTARRVGVPTGMACDNLGASGKPEPGSGMRVTLVPFESIGKPAPRVVNTPDYAAGLESNMYDELVELAASLGPYLFVHTKVFDYACGAHGGQSHDFYVYDLESGNKIPLYDDQATRALGKKFESMALQNLRDEQVHDGAPLFSTHLTLTASWPTFDPGSPVSMQHQWTASTCYACSDGEWDSYTASTLVGSSDLPVSLAPYSAAAADAVRLLHGVIPDLSVRGVSFPEPASGVP